MRDADVDPGLRVVGDDVLAHAAPHDADVEADAAARVAEPLQDEDLARELLDRARPLLRVRARVRGAAEDREAVAREPLARRLQVAARRRRLEDEGGRDVTGRLLDQRPRREAAD